MITVLSGYTRAGNIQSFHRFDANNELEYMAGKWHVPGVDLLRH